MVSRVMSFRSIAFALLLAGMGCSQKMITSLPGADQTGVRLPNGWHLTPAGQTIGVGDLPMNLAVSHDRRLIAVTNNGESEQSIELIDVPGARVIDVMPIPQSWLGIEFARDDRRIYASAGNLNSIRIYTVEKNSLRLQDSIVLGKAWPVRISPTGLALDESRDRLYVVTKENNSLYVVDLRTKSILKRDTLEGEAYTCILSPDHATLYVSVWGNKNVCVYDTRSDSITTRIPTGRNPNDLCLTKDGLYLFVANSQDNSISVIDTRRNEVLETLNAAMFPQSPEGSTTNSIGLSEDGRTLYAANADNNCLAVFNVERPGHSVSRGFIPTGWYPTCVRVVDGRVWVANGKGISSLPNPRGPNPSRRRGKAEESKRREQYIGGLLKGTINVLREPDEAQLAQYSRMVYRNSPYSPSGASTAEGESGNPIPVRPGDPSPIKHVFYVIKENRTYDQVLGDEPRGNGDTSLCLFPERITPNEHALAREFVLLDNFYVDGEVSADGHNWSTAAYANDFIEKTWPTRYGGRGGEYDYIGNRSIALPLNGFIWDDCLAHHVSFRNYGEFGDEGPPKLKSLTEQTCGAYPGWNLKIKDTTRERVWEHDFDSLVAGNALPAMSLVYLPNDHTSGLSKGAFSPFAAVADNDLALGKLIEHLSKSPVWNESAVFVLEDDAQDGPDHVDAHRSIAFVAGGHVRRHFVDHTMYSSSSMLRTMELILGLPPMSQYDASAVPMWRCFNGSPDRTAFTALPARIDLDDRNLAIGNSTEASAPFDLSGPDRAPVQDLNRAIWLAVRGEGSVMPPPRRGAFVSPKDDD